MSTLVGCHSSLGVSTVIMSSFGNLLCRLPAHLGAWLCLHMCAYLCTLCTRGYKTTLYVCVFFGMCTPENVCA